MKVITNPQGKVVIQNNKALAVQGTSPDPVLPKYTGHVDTVGLTALGWDSYDIQWLQDHVWWDAADDAYWAVTEANLAFGPNGATSLTWANRATQKMNPDIRFYPKFDPSPSSNTSWNALMSGYVYVYAIPTHGWDTQYVTNFGSLFAGCQLLRTVGDLSGWNTSNVTSFGSMFLNCYSLMYVGDLSNWNTANVTAMSSMFQNCNFLRDIGELANWNVTNVTAFTSLFQNCYSITRLDLSNWNTGNATGAVSMFADCWNLCSVGNLSNWNTSKMTSFQSMFYNCRRLSSIGDISRWNTEKVTSMQTMFAGCSILKSLGDLSNWDTGEVTSTSIMFNNCNLLNLIGVTNWDMGKNTTLQGMFSQCRYLYKLNCSSWDVSKVTSTHQTFHYCTNLVELDLSGWDLSLCSNVGTTQATSIFASLTNITKIKLGPKFFNGSSTTYYFNSFYCWTRDSIYESLYTNQTLRSGSSTAITVKLSNYCYDSLSAQDISDIATKNITLTRG